MLPGTSLAWGAQPPRLHRSAPRRPDRVFGEGADHGTRGACAPHAKQLVGQDTRLYGRRDAGRYNSFTLIEIIAVLAVIAILVAMIVPTVIRRVDQAAWTAETANLSNIADALSQSIIRTKTIPSYTNSATIPNWASTVADQMSLPV